MTESRTQYSQEIKFCPLSIDGCMRLFSVSEKNVLTVIVPVRNMASRLGLFQSWLAKIGHLPISVHVVVDDSSDETLKEVLTIVAATKNQHITVISGHYLSPGATRNAGLVNITTKWIAFWDSDDYPFAEEVIAAIGAVCEKTNVIVGCYISSEFSSSPNWMDFHTAQTSEQSVINILRNPGLWRWVFSAELIKEIKFPKYLMGEDQCFLAEVLIREPVIQYSDKVFYSYSVNRIGSLTSSKNKYIDLKKAIATIALIAKKSKKITTRLLLELAVIRLRLTLIKSYIK